MDEEARLPRLLGRYVLLGHLASGGMGTVYLARQHGDLGFGRTVAVKCLHPALAEDPRFVADFLKEGRLAARIRHPNVIPTLDVIASGGELALVMEYVDCVTLGTLKRKLSEIGEGIPIPIAAAIMAQVLTGLHAAHETSDEDGAPLGIVHRDVSGQNVLLGLDGVARVADFGVAKVAGELTERSGFKGKLGYIAPEQLSGEAVDRRADVWSAGVLLWETVVRRRLFFGEPGEIVRKIMQHEVPPPSRYVPTIAPEIEIVILRALAASPQRRFRSALEMAAELERAVTHLPTTREIAEWLRGALGPELDLALRKVRELEQHARALEEPFEEEAETIVYSDSQEQPIGYQENDVTALTTAYEPPPPPASSLRPVAMPSAPPPASWGDASWDGSWARASEPSYYPYRRRRRAALLTLVGTVAASLAFFFGIVQPTTLHTAAAPPPAAAEEIPSAPPPAPAPPAPMKAAPPPTGTAPARAHQKTRAACSPPWTLDAEGVRVPKPECF